MKKSLIIELFFVFLLLLFALAVTLYITMEWSIPGLFPEPTTAATTEPTQVTTEPTFVLETEPAPTDPVFEVPEITWKTYDLERELTCTQAFVYDCQAETYLFRMGDAQSRVWMASITKLFSIYVATQYLDPEWRLLADTVLDRIPEDASTAKLEKGDVLTVSQLLEGMLLPSGNDAAYLIATETGRQIAGDPNLDVDAAIAVFVEEMNRQAQLLGMAGTHFANPDGYHHEEHYTNYNDLVTIGKLALENETIMAYSVLPKDVVTPLIGHDKEWMNTNLLVNPEYEYYCPYAIGLKTGQTDMAGSCLLSAFDVNGRKYIIGVFGSPTFNGKLDDTLQLFNAKVINGPTGG